MNSLPGKIQNPDAGAHTGHRPRPRRQTRAGCPCAKEVEPMENREAKYCPLLSGSRGGPELCRGEYCAWCTRLEVYPGRVLHSCAVTDIASSLRIIAGK